METSTMNKHDIQITGKTNGAASSEHKVTWAGIALGIGAILIQLAGLWLGVDLHIDIDTILLFITGGGGVYTLSRMAVKMGVAFAEGKAKAAQPAIVPAQPVEREATRLPSAKPTPLAQAAPFRSASAPPQEETTIY